MSEPHDPGAGTPSSQAAPPYAPGITLGARLRIADTTPVYTWLIWVLALAPLIGIVTSFFSVPVYRFRVVAGVRTIDPASIFTPGYLASLVLALVVWALTIVFAYVDGAELRRRGVERPFSWAWSFLASGVYVIGRSVIVHRVASPRGLAPVWTWIAATVVSTIIGFAAALPQMLAILQHLPTPPR